MQGICFHAWITCFHGLKQPTILIHLALQKGLFMPPWFSVSEQSALPNSTNHPSVLLDKETVWKLFFGDCFYFSFLKKKTNTSKRALDETTISTFGSNLGTYTGLGGDFIFLYLLFVLKVEVHDSQWDTTCANMFPNWMFFLKKTPPFFGDVFGSCFDSLKKQSKLKFQNGVYCQGIWCVRPPSKEMGFRFDSFSHALTSECSQLQVRA